ncbi:SDR family NAD(P)-dependent oxidoreductase [Tengunoibacter tsumagoiensis]|uniref:Beta-ketoacyl-ACP reductase n=1 Tax=Tengunoibacter tsumagoiensis TaxID=2014871 RepID=A0A402A796_9CHLR|nr:3-oxoacyl-ACP reductase FabG [Tengunoibacter tsumagoiensis]GCE14915.1 beta-ketoacyl-ACP reductase [Tengunoibacter tsumagoiensis]
MKFDGQVALVTGASRGIGRAIALALADEGAKVAVNYRSGASYAQEVVDEILARGGTAFAVQADVANAEQVHEMVQKILSRWDSLHILVNNAGIAKDGLIFHMDENSWQEVMQVNFGGVFHCTKAVLEQFMLQRSGVIVNISSVMGERGWVGEANYSASKGAINAFTRCCAMEFARFGIRVNAVLPGFCPTDMVEGLLEKNGGKGILKQIPLRSFAQPEEIAQVALFLASADASHVSGSLLTVDGGLSAVAGVGSPLS